MNRVVTSWAFALAMIALMFPRSVFQSSQIHIPLPSKAEPLGEGGDWTVASLDGCRNPNGADHDVPSALKRIFPASAFLGILTMSRFPRIRFAATLPAPRKRTTGDGGTESALIRIHPPAGGESVFAQLLTGQQRTYWTLGLGSAAEALTAEASGHSAARVVMTSDRVFRSMEVTFESRAG